MIAGGSTRPASASASRSRRISDWGSAPPRRSCGQLTPSATAVSVAHPAMAPSTARSRWARMAISVERMTASCRLRSRRRSAASCSMGGWVGWGTRRWSPCPQAAAHRPHGWPGVQHGGDQERRQQHEGEELGSLGDVHATSIEMHRGTSQIVSGAGHGARRRWTGFPRSCNRPRPGLMAAVLVSSTWRNGVSPRSSM